VIELDAFVQGRVQGPKLEKVEPFQPAHVALLESTLALYQNISLKCFLYYSPSSFSFIFASPIEAKHTTLTFSFIKLYAQHPCIDLCTHSKMLSRKSSRKAPLTPLTAPFFYLSCGYFLVSKCSVDYFRLWKTRKDSARDVKEKKNALVL
jgi:hypothetical protein